MEWANSPIYSAAPDANPVAAGESWPRRAGLPDTMNWWPTSVRERAVVDDLIKRGLQRPQFLIVDGAPGLEKTIAAVWDDVPVQRCTVHKHRNLLAHAPERLHEEATADYTDMI